MSTPVLEWKYGQSFGQKEAFEDKPEADTLTAVEFDETGDFLATGDRGGRIVIFNAKSEKDLRTKNYAFYTEFQSHDPEFDYLKSLEIEEKINKIRWCKTPNHAKFLISTNDKTIKCWKIHNKKIKTVSSMNIVGGSSRSVSVSGSAPPLRIQNLQIPKISTSETSIVATPKRVYGNAHAYHINSISCNSDGEHFLSADDLRVNLWNLERSDQCFNMLDIKPNNMEDLTEVITSAEFHPTHCNIFIYSSSGGSIRLGDMRASSLCDSHAMMFEEPEDPSTRSFFSEIISSVSDVKFTKDGRYLISRDYLNLKIWDVNMESKPVKTIAIHDHLRPKLCDLYENDCIFDKFESAVSADGQNYVTGSYNNFFHIYDRYGKVEKTIEATNAPEAKGKGKIAATPKKKEKADDKLDFTKKALHTAWHPQQNTVAVTISSNLYIYHGEPV